MHQSLYLCRFTKSVSGAASGSEVDRLLEAARKGDEDEMKKLLTDGWVYKKVDVNGISSSGLTSLTGATVVGRDNSVRYLYSHGAYLDLVDNHGWTALMYACKHHRLGILEWLLTRTADPNIKNKQDNTALHMACEIGEVKFVELLLKNNASLTCVNNQGNSALHFACAKGSTELVDLLLKQGVAHACQNNEGNTALHIACGNGAFEIVNLLLKHGASLTCQNNEGNAALHVACRSGTLEIAILLLEHGANLTCQNKMGDVAIDVACQENRLSFIKLLIQHGAKHGCSNTKHKANSVSRCSHWTCSIVQDLVSTIQSRERAEEVSAMKAHLLQLTTERNAALAEMDIARVTASALSTERDALSTLLNQRTMERDVALSKLARAQEEHISVRSNLSTQRNELEKLLIERVEMIALQKERLDNISSENNALTTLQCLTQEERDAARMMATAMTLERDNLALQLAQMSQERDAALGEGTGYRTKLTSATTKLECLNRELHAQETAIAVQNRLSRDRKMECNRLSSERDDLLKQLAESKAQRDALATIQVRLQHELTECMREKDTAQLERDELRAQSILNAAANCSDMYPFKRYQPHCFIPGIVPICCGAGLYDVESTSSLFNHVRLLTRTGGIWLLGKRELSRFRLAHVQAVVPPPFLLEGYLNQKERMNSLRATGGTHFNYDTATGLNAQQLLVLNTLRSIFHERPPGSSERNVNTVYCYHGPRRAHLESVCTNGLVAVREMDAGFFGGGCYTTLNIEYAARYAYGDFDKNKEGQYTGPRASSDGLYPVVMLVATVGMAYPITPEADYSSGEKHSHFFGRPLKPGFDTHVVCVNDATKYQAVPSDQCEYVELVVDQQAQLLPLAVLWFEKIN